MPSQTLFLASKSPRRRELLTRLGYEVRVIASHTHTLCAFDGDETVLPGEAPEDYVVRTARNKFLEGLAVKAAGEFAGVQLPVVAADTVVSLGSEILGKPRDFAEACSFLEKLSGRTHDVRTAVYVGWTESRCEYRVSRSTVTFRTLTREEIELYVRTGEPYDKAGGYGIQGLASIFISEIRGSYTGIMGLPVFETAELLKNAGLPVL
ncbi:MAG: septum formation inhibitor Maf [Sutterella sp.]|nr:septum formation inhibitor Maf [Sutterella sp.]